MKKGIFQLVLNERLHRFHGNTAIEYGDRKVSYAELDTRSDCIAEWIIRKEIKQKTFIGILIDDRVEFITAVIGILKAGCVFVPLDPAYPKERLAEMIRSTGIGYILGDTGNSTLFSPDDPVGMPTVEYFPVEELFLDHWAAGTAGHPHLPVVSYSPGDPVYIYFTSGTSGAPKAVLGMNKSLLHFIRWEIETFGIDETYRVSQFTTPMFDAFLRDVFVPLCSGGVVCIPGREIMSNADELVDWIDNSGIHLIHCVPGLFRLINSHPLTREHFQALKLILLSGEEIAPRDLASWYPIFDERIQLVNFYGPTETTMIKAYYPIQKSDVDKERIPIGKPIRGCRLIVCNEKLEICNKLIKGEIYIRTPFRTLGYYNDPELNKKRFIPNPFTNNPDDPLYKTGDFGKLLPDGNIEFLGRIDRQVKIRGIRIELEEIENAIKTHPSVKQAIAIKSGVSRANEILCAYITAAAGDGTVIDEASLIAGLKDYLPMKLPVNMIPARLIILKEIPRKPNGKVDYDELQKGVGDEAADLTAPSDNIEIKLLEIWSEILDTKKIGVNVNFFELGGNSLNVMTLLAKIHREFEVRIPLGEIFNNSTIARQAGIIKNANQEKFVPTKSVERKDYYALSSAQKRIYILQGMNPGNTAYNIPIIVQTEGRLDRDRFEEAFGKLINRHESLRTSFMLVEEEPIQRIYREVEFEIKSHEAAQVEVDEIIKNFIKPFDLSKAPLLRVGLVKLAEEKNILVVDLHHIICDRISKIILIDDFMALYAGDALPPLRCQYKSYSEWQNSKTEKQELKSQEEFWLKQFEGQLPILDLPTDFIRPAVQRFEGGSKGFKIDGELLAGLKSLAVQEGTTLFIILLSIFNIMLSRISGQEDIIVGTPTAGRQHVDLENIIGMLVNTLPMRNYPNEEKTFGQFLDEVTKRTLDVFENQDYQFEVLVDKLALDNNPARNPLFDVLFVLQNRVGKTVEMPGMKLRPYNYTIATSKFDLTLYCQETTDMLLCILEYCTRLFKPQKIERFISYFKEIATAVVKDNEIRLKDIKISHDLISIQKENLEMDFGF